MKRTKRFGAWALLALLFVGGGIACMPGFGTTFYSVPISSLPEDLSGFRIVHLSDLHGRVYGERQALLLREIFAASPDIVVMTGDMLGEKGGDAELFCSFSRKVAQRFPTYYVSGNHEQRLEPAALFSLLEELEECGVHVLQNSAEIRLVGKARLQIAGFVLPLEEYSAHCVLRPQEIVEVLGKPDPSAFTLLLTHNPLRFSAYAEWGADLVLAGHVHGGMIRLPVFGGLLSPERRFFPKYQSGLYTLIDASMEVSRGLGDGFGVRVFNRSELVVLNLEKR